VDIFGQFFRIDNVFEARSACANSVFSTPKVRCTAFASPNRSGRITRHEHDLPSAAPSHVGFWHLADNPTAPAFLDQSWHCWSLARDGLVVNDPLRRWACACVSRISSFCVCRSLQAGTHYFHKIVTSRHSPILIYQSKFFGSDTVEMPPGPLALYLIGGDHGAAG
jgi:hypothetical protein